MSSKPDPLDPTPASDARLGLAIASLVLGVLAVCLSVLLVGGLFGLIGAVLAVVHLRRRQGGPVMARWGAGLSVLGLLATAGFATLYIYAFGHLKTAMKSARSSAEAVEQWEGVPAPDLTLTTLDGNTTALSELKGKRVVLDFWETWCGPCRREIPHFTRLVAETSCDDLVVIGISAADEPTLRRFVDKEKIPYSIASSARITLPKPFASIRAVPTTFFIDRNGIIQSVVVGYHDFDALRGLALQKDLAIPTQAQPEPPAAGVKP